MAINNTTNDTNQNAGIANPTPTPTASAQPEIPEKKKNTNRKKGKYNLLIGGLILLILIVAGLGYYSLIFRGNNSLPVFENPKSIDETEVEYISNDYGYSMVIKKEWDVNEVGNKVIFFANDDSVLNFEAFTGEEFSTIESVDDEFCDAFETGFKEGIEDSGVADQFEFKVFEQNGIFGCVAEGEIVAGYKQKYNVFFNPNSKEVYSLFYTVPGEVDTTDLDMALASFSLTIQ